LALSYFVAPETSDGAADQMLAGDRNLATNGVGVPSSYLDLSTNLSVGFTKAMHNHAGNILMGDGSVQQVNDARLRETVLNALSNTRARSVRLLIP
jgi:prepilin-type processing-associated H-X9-DG protein